MAMNPMNRIGRSVGVLAGACLLTLFGCSVHTDSGGAPSLNDKAPVAPKFDPTVARTAATSTSLMLAPDWRAPAPTRTASAVMKKRVQAKKQYGVATATLSDAPTDAELRASSRFLEPLRPVPGTSTAQETRALAAALREESHDDRAIGAIESFLGAYPGSRWAPAIHLNLGSISF